MSDLSSRAPFRRSEFERQATLAIGSLLTAGILWMAAAIGDNTTALAGLRVQIEALRDQVAELKGLTKAALPAEDARRELSRVDALMVDLEARLRRVEGRR
ncbi:hypothetical protein [Zavarzinia aquatilis]|uniref:Uncharacterized protein n=1 Tax=Zavarzinia aquatilis TaxID=2211142 RepID=A0A317E7W9_9PROT|nr:hypothetical protein [Zavarzinia aquatilis]PWR22761.1 hypothetical protein DKG74_10010 [Zavarzinia aquatilis]